MSGGGDRRPILLVGLRGAGKTALGRALAAQLALPFVDLDDLVGEEAGRPAARVLAEDGEAAFRALEERCFTAWRRRHRGLPVVFALGGGAVESPGVRRGIAAMKRDEGAVVVWLTADREVLAARIEEDRRAGRLRPPLSGRSLDEELRVLAARRFRLYRGLADLCFQNQRRGLDALAARLAALLP